MKTRMLFSQRQSMNNKVLFIILLILFNSFNSLYAQKKWPMEPLRGLNTRVITNIDKFPRDSMSYLNEEHFKVFDEWNVNVLRVRFRLDPEYLKEKLQYELPLGNEDWDPDCYKESFSLIEQTLEYAAKYDMQVILFTNKEIRGGKTGIFYDEKKKKGYYFEILNIWKYIAKKYGSHPNLLAIDPLGEPVPKIELEKWSDYLFEEFIAEIQTIDKETFIMYAPGPRWRNDNFKDLKPFDNEKVVYTFHFYYPFEYTHQGLKNHSQKPIEYPGYAFSTFKRDKIYWDKIQMKNYLRVAIDFCNKYDKKLFIGEFSTVRWAPAADKWVNDILQTLEENNVSWSYHGIGGWNGWNPTFAKSDRKNSESFGNMETKSLENLKSFWSLNKQE
jgi:endoglucanase